MNGIVIPIINIKIMLNGVFNIKQYGKKDLQPVREYSPFIKAQRIADFLTTNPKPNRYDSGII